MTLNLESNIIMSGKVLLVDDSPQTRNSIKDALKGLFSNFIEADDGLGAIKVFVEEKPGFIITDVEMPKIDGFTLTQRLRNNESYRETPIIIVTSREKDEDKKRGIAVGANAYIVKGAFDQSNLLDTIQNLVG